ncbi:hypothetical protein NMG60_11021302 [Bertholletia excelsa]
MFKQSPCRSYRSQGIKVKHVLQFCFLLACCFWLIHQVKPCHDEKEALNENEAKTSPKRDSHNGVLKLGRKDLDPQLEESQNAKREHDEEEAEGIVGGEEGEEESKPGEEESKPREEEEEESKPGDEGEEEEEEEEEEDRGGGDDEIDELDQERKFEGEEDFVDVKEDREVKDQEAEAEHSEDNERQSDNRISLEEAIAGEEGGSSKNSPLLSPEVAVEPNGQLEVGNNTTSENTNLEATSLGHENNSKTASNSNQIDSILMIPSNTEKAEEPRDESSNSFATSELAVAEKVRASNATSHGSSEPVKDVDNSPEIRSQGNKRGVAAE